MVDRHTGDSAHLRVCGWRKGGIDSWDGHRCKCGHSALPIDLAKLMADTEVPEAARMYVNYVTLRNGKVAAICESCGKRSKATARNHKGEPELWEIGRGWSQAPFPEDFKHRDGSTGSTYTCPSCNARLKSGQSITLRDYEP